MSGKKQMPMKMVLVLTAGICGVVALLVLILLYVYRQRLLEAVTS